MQRYLLTLLILLFAVPVFAHSIGGGSIGPAPGGSGLNQAAVEAIYSGADGTTKIGAYTDDASAVQTLDDLHGHTLPKWVLDDSITITVATDGLGVVWGAGYCWDANSSEGVQTWVAGSGDVTNNDTTYLVCNPDAADPTILELTTTDPTVTGNYIEIARFDAVDSLIWGWHEEPELTKATTGLFHGMEAAFPVLITNGMVVSEDTDATNTWDVSMTAGQWFADGHKEYTVAATDSRGFYLVRWYKAAGVWKADTSSVEIDSTQYNNGTDLAAVTAGSYYKSIFLWDGISIHWIYPDTAYLTIAAAAAGPLPDGPPGYLEWPQMTAVILRGNAVAFPSAGGAQWIDIRQSLGTSNTFAAASDHGNLSGLSDDDHLIYSLADGTRAFTGVVTVTTTAPYLYLKDSDDTANNADMDLQAAISGTGSGDVAQWTIGDTDLNSSDLDITNHATTGTDRGIAFGVNNGSVGMYLNQLGRLTVGNITDLAQAPGMALYVDGTSIISAGSIGQAFLMDDNDTAQNADADLVAALYGRGSGGGTQWLVGDDSTSLDDLRIMNLASSATTCGVSLEVSGGSTGMYLNKSGGLTVKAPNADDYAGSTYAIYANGDTHVQGDLTVSGSVPADATKADLDGSSPFTGVVTTQSASSPGFIIKDTDDIANDGAADLTGMIYFKGQSDGIAYSIGDDSEGSSILTFKNGDSSNFTSGFAFQTKATSYVAKCNRDGHWAFQDVSTTSYHDDVVFLDYTLGATSIFAESTGNAIMAHYATGTVGRRVNIGLVLDNTNGVPHEYAQIGGVIDSNGNGTETGDMVLSTMNAGALVDRAYINHQGGITLGGTATDLADATYAVYSNGDLHVQGDLTVSGSAPGGGGMSEDSTTSWSASSIMNVCGNMKGLWMMAGATTTMDDEAYSLQDVTLNGGLTIATDQATNGYGWKLTFDGSGDYGSIADDDSFSFGDGSNDQAVSFIAMIDVTDDANVKVIASKWDETTASEVREYALELTATETLQFFVYDESANAYESRVTSAGLAVGQHLVVVTYDGGGGTTASDGMLIYVDGEVVASSASDSGTYVAMENGATQFWLGALEGTGGTDTDNFPSFMSVVGIEKSEMTASEVWRLWKVIEGVYSL